MSLGLIVDSRSEPVSLYEPENGLASPLCTGVPSTTMSGSLPALMLLIPLILMLFVPPGAPDVWLIDTPATPPDSLSAIEITGTSCIASVFRLWAEPVNDAFLKLP